MDIDTNRIHTAKDILNDQFSMPDSQEQSQETIRNFLHIGKIEKIQEKLKAQYFNKKIIRNLQIKAL